MAKGEQDLSQTENWNVAEKYVSLKIMKPLYECDVFFDLAMYGAESIQEAVTMPEAYKIIVRKQAFDRLIKKLQMVIDNTHFALKNPDQVKLNDLEKDLTEVEKYQDAITVKNYDQVAKTTTEIINEEHFLKSIEVLRKIKRNINTPLNNGDLIFRKGIEFDLEKIKQALINEG